MPHYDPDTSTLFLTAKVGAGLRWLGVCVWGGGGVKCDCKYTLPELEDVVLSVSR